MKGSVPMWVWISGGLVAGVLFFIGAHSMLFDTTKIIADQKAVEPFYLLRDLASGDLCYAAAGNKRLLEIELREGISAIYSTDDKYTTLEDAEYTEKVLAGETSSGKLLCLKRSGRRLACEELNCVVGMPYLGAVPAERSLSAMIDKVLGRQKTYAYSLVLTKESDKVDVALS
ncbi:MAG: hypothetical protein ACP5E4_00180 [Candidatus Aenigmatarchaeota archaeon]